VIVEKFSATATIPDVIHIHGLWSPFLHRICEWGRSHRVPFVISPQGMLTPWSLSQKRLKKQLARVLYQDRDLRTAGLMHATAESEVEDIRRVGLRQPIVIAPFGIDIPESSSSPGRGASSRDSQRMALFVSRIHPKKGLANLLDAWSRLKLLDAAGTAGPHPAQSWHLVIAGPDEAGHKAELLAQAARLGLSVAERSAAPDGKVPLTADVIFTGPVFDAQKTSLYQQADLFVLPTHSENFGVVILEALACGLPVITTKGAPWQRLENVGRAAADPSQSTRAGWWIDIGVNPLVTALREAMQATDEERARIGDNARWFAQEKYSWPAAAQAMNQAYDWLIHGGPPPGCIRL
jgi:glycosyltransferase involved in cell wall biosynthesis